MAVEGGLPADVALNSSTGRPPSQTAPGKNYMDRWTSAASGLEMECLLVEQAGRLGLEVPNAQTTAAAHRGPEVEGGGR